MMVRLEVWWNLTDLKHATEFQFHDGAIGREGESLHYFVYRKFQFHDGAIGSNLDLIFIAGSPHFNSMMVRLEDSGSSSKATVILHFNSMMVRLEDNCLNMLPLCQSHFNSMMVRLEVSPAND